MGEISVFVLLVVFGVLLLGVLLLRGTKFTMMQLLEAVLIVSLIVVVVLIVLRVAS